MDEHDVNSLVADYLRNHLSINISTSQINTFEGDNSINIFVELFLDDELISESEDYIPISSKD